MCGGAVLTVHGSLWIDYPKGSEILLEGYGQRQDLESISGGYMSCLMIRNREEVMDVDH